MLAIAIRWDTTAIAESDSSYPSCRQRVSIAVPMLPTSETEPSPMVQRATSSFVIDNKDFAPVEWIGGGLSRGRFEKTFTGDLAGAGVVEAVLLRTENEGLAVYVGIERIECTLHGRTGSFLLLHQAMQPGAATWTIAERSGTGDLAGITGAGEILPGHGFTLDYEL